MHQLIHRLAFAPMHLALALAFASACASTPKKPEVKAPPPPAPLTDDLRVKGLAAIDEVFNTISRYYVGTVPVRPEVIWTDLVNRLRQASAGIITIQATPPIFRFSDSKGRSYVTTVPSSVEILRERIVDLVRFCRDSSAYADWGGPMGVERIAIAALLCNLDANSRLISPRQMYTALPEGSPSRAKYQKAATVEAWPPPFAQCRDMETGPTVRASDMDRLESGVLMAQLQPAPEGMAAHLKQRTLFTLQHYQGPLRGMVLDLRTAPITRFSETNLIADLFLDEGPGITLQDPRMKTAETRTTTDGREFRFPLVLLMDETCTAACRALAMLLRDRGRALLVGRPSTSMSHLQNLFELPPSIGGMLLTTSAIKTFAGSPMELAGTEPDVIVLPHVRGLPVNDKYARKILVNLSDEGQALVRFAISVITASKGSGRAQLLESARRAAATHQ